VLAGVRPTVQLQVVTRWAVEEIAAGVSDLRVLDIVLDCGGKLFLCPQLHAKYYRADRLVLVGSANITARALGWSPSPNVELLTEIDWDAPLVEFECRLADASIEASSSLRDALEAAVGELPRQQLSDEAQQGWLPGLRFPSDLLLAYEGKWEKLGVSVRAAAVEDLAVLSIPAGLSRNAARVAVGMALLRQPIIAAVDRFLASPRRFGEVAELLANSSARPRSEADYLWQTLMRWLKYFLPWRYQFCQPVFSEIVARKD